MTSNEKRKVVRRNFFILLLGLILTTYFIVDYYDLYDGCLTLY
jgi:hypothetical protein